MATLTLSPAHGAVLAVTASSVIIHNVYMSLRIGQARRKYGVRFPDLYAPADHKHANEFNCMQRGHQNSLESLPSFYALLLTAGVRFPVSASIAGTVFLLGRIVYFKGYSTGDPKARLRGNFNHLGQLALLGMVVRWSAELLTPALGL